MQVNSDSVDDTKVTEVCLDVCKSKLFAEKSCNIKVSGSARRKSLSLKKRKNATQQEVTSVDAKKLCNMNLCCESQQANDVICAETLNPLAEDCAIISKRALPLSPTFSPRKTTCSSFSPSELGKCVVTNEEQTPTAGFNASISLFSSPSPNLLTSPHASRNKQAKRTLFPSPATRTENSSEYANVSCLGSDISLSEFLNLSAVVSSEASAINRYLVLEVVSQTSADIGR